jgi:hypothetical protein
MTSYHPVSLIFLVYTLYPVSANGETESPVWMTDAHRFHQERSEYGCGGRKGSSHRMATAQWLDIEESKDLFTLEEL